MGRASFGGAQDLSAAFAAFYRDYEDQLATLARRAENRTQEEQAAADSDAIDRWQQGEMNDAQFLRYAERRIEESKGEEPEDLAYWKKVLRDARKSILTEQISDGAEDLIDKINAGKATWGDLLSFYTHNMRGLSQNDPLRKSIEDQMEQVRDRIAENKVQGRFAEIGYLFESGKMSGSAAGAAIRKLAQRYKVNDPARYYQMLQQALQLEHVGGSGGGGGGGGGGGSSSGGGGSAAGFDDVLDQLKVREDQIMALSEQANDGVNVGEVVTYDRRGRVHTEEVPLLNRDGSPSPQMRQLDEAMIDNYNRMIHLLIKEGSTEAGTKIKALEYYITDHVQPRNTVGPEKQANAMLQNGLALIEDVANSEDPVGNWRRVQAWADGVARWERGLNRVNAQIPNKRKFTADELRANPELKATQLISGTVGKDRLDQTTEEFGDQAAILRALASALASGDAAAAEKALNQLDQSSESSGINLPSSYVNPMIERVKTALDLVKGIPEGRYVRVFVPGEGLVYAPVQTTFATIPGPDGRLMTQAVAVPVRPDGSPIADGNKGEQLVDTMVEINGKVEIVKAVAEPAFFVGNERVSFSEYKSAVKQYAESEDKSKLDAPSEYQQVLVPGRSGSAPEVWLLDPSTNLWFRNKISKYGGVPLIFSGKNAEAAQQVANQLGVDQKGTSYYNAPLVQRTREAQANKDWYDQATGLSRQEAMDLKRREFAQAFQTNAGLREGGSDILNGANDVLSRFGFGGIGAGLLEVGRQLGIKSFDDQEKRQVNLPTFAAQREGTVRRDLTPERKPLPKIDLPPLPTFAQQREGSVAPRPRRRQITPDTDARGYGGLGGFRAG